jgi:phosphatidylinositol glycan class W
MQQAAMEVALIILPMAASLLGGSSAACAIGVGLLGVCFLASGSAVPASAASVHSRREDGGMLHPLTLFRALMMAQTAFCILAVDFRVLPRRFAKSAHWGTSVMDIGIASAAFSRSIVQRSRPRQRGAHACLQRTAPWPAPVFCLGVARTVFIRLSGYPQPLDEYGAHCNAFLMLGVAGIAVDRLAPTRASMAAAAGIGLLIVHQAVLTSGFASWVETAERHTLLSSNKEAVVGAIGLVGIGCIGNAVGGLMPLAACQLPSRGWGSSLAALATTDAALWAAAAAAARLASPPSRRLCNLAFGLWSSAQLVTALCLCVLASYRSPPAPIPLLGTMNRHLVLVFLAANLATGAVNMTMRALGTPTMEAAHWLASVILSVYVALLLAFAVACDHVQGAAKPPFTARA